LTFAMTGYGVAVYSALNYGGHGFTASSCRSFAWNRAKSGTACLLRDRWGLYWRHPPSTRTVGNSRILATPPRVNAGIWLYLLRCCDRNSRITTNVIRINFTDWFSGLQARYNFQILRIDGTRLIGRVSQGSLSRVEVTGMYWNPSSLMPW